MRRYIRIGREIRAIKRALFLFFFQKVGRASGRMAIRRMTATNGALAISGIVVGSGEINVFPFQAMRGLSRTL